MTRSDNVYSSPDRMIRSRRMILAGSVVRIGRRRRRTPMGFGEEGRK
jgi:hypothetical protein